jgi:hypothetical protein
LRSLKTKKQNGETNSVQKNTSIFILIPKRYRYCSASWFLENQSMWDHYIPTFSKKEQSHHNWFIGSWRNRMFGLCAHHGRQCRCRIFRFIRIAVNQFRHSMGGYVALAFAELYPEYVKAWRYWIQQPEQTAKNENNRDRAIKAVKHSL